MTAPLPEEQVYAAIGEEGFARLTTSFYRRIPGDDVLGPMYPATQLEAARSRLNDFLVFRFGGPQRYIEHRGHPRLRGRHIPFRINQAARDRWIELMTAALAETDLPTDAAATLQHFFDGAATFLINAE